MPANDQEINEVGPAPPRRRASTVTTLAQSVQSAASVVGDILNKDPPPGFFAAAAETAANVPTVGEIRRGRLGSLSRGAGVRRSSQQGFEIAEDTNPGQSNNRDTQGGRDRPRYTRVRTELDIALHNVEEERHTTSVQPGEPSREYDAMPDSLANDTLPYLEPVESRRVSEEHKKTILKPLARVGKVYSSGYVAPPVIPWSEAITVGFRAFLKWSITPFGFFWMVYGLNVVAWGGMLFLLLINAAPAMCHSPIASATPAGHPSPVDSLRLIRNLPRHHDCNDLFSPRRIWLEIDSQILNALFCVTGFGLAPWRFRDLWYILKFRLTSSKRQGMEKKLYGLRKLAGFYRNWYRLPGSNTLDVPAIVQYEDKTVIPNKTFTVLHLQNPTIEQKATELRVPLPVSRTPADPATGVRAPPTPGWAMDFFIWCQVANTAFQAVLCGFMWGMNRYDRPSWATGLFIALGCIIAGIGGIVAYVEGNRVKRVEGPPQPVENIDVSV